MDKLEKEKLKKKMKLHKNLGALQFQKVVFGVEKLKFKILKTVFPNFLKYFDKYCDYQKKKAIDNANSEEEVNRIQEYYITAKMSMRRELNLEQNINYHMNNDKPTEIIKYLNWNKNIHKRNLAFNAMAIAVLSLGTAAAIPGALPVLILELIAAGINFECINIQDFNICRYKIQEDVLRKKEEKKTKENIEKYGDIAHKAKEKRNKKGDILTSDEMIDCIDNIEQLEQFKKMIDQKRKERKNHVTYSSEKVKQIVR